MRIIWGKFGIDKIYHFYGGLSFALLTLLITRRIGIDANRGRFYHFGGPYSRRLQGSIRRLDPKGGFRPYGRRLYLARIRPDPRYMV